MRGFVDTEISDDLVCERIEPAGAGESAQIALLAPVKDARHQGFAIAAWLQRLVIETVTSAESSPSRSSSQSLSAFAPLAAIPSPSAASASRRALLGSGFGSGSGVESGAPVSGVRPSGAPSGSGGGALEVTPPPSPCSGELGV